MSTQSDPAGPLHGTGAVACTGKNGCQGRLSRSVRPGDDDELAAVDGEAHAVKRVARGARIVHVDVGERGGQRLDRGGILVDAQWI